MEFKDRYQYNPVTNLLGKGGFARVYKAEDKLLNRIVALKFFVPSEDKRHTLIQEISRAISLNHENLCRYYDAAIISSTNLHGEIENVEVGVIEYIDGGDIKSFLEKNAGHLDKLLIDVLQGIGFLHQKGIIHRDLKPQNILVKTFHEQFPVAKITDFGISKDVLSDTGNSSKLMGTIEYMAPEQFNPDKYGINGRISFNLDLWSFGLLLYELLTGKTIFGSRGGETSAEQIMTNILNENMANERVNELADPYRTILKKCLVKSAAARIQKAEELISILKYGVQANQPEQNAAPFTLKASHEIKNHTEDIGKIAPTEHASKNPISISKPKKKANSPNKNPQKDPDESSKKDRLAEESKSVTNLQVVSLPGQAAPASSPETSILHPQLTGVQLSHNTIVVKPTDESGNDPHTAKHRSGTKRPAPFPHGNSGVTKKSPAVKIALWGTLTLAVVMIAFYLVRDPGNSVGEATTKQAAYTQQSPPPNPQSPVNGTLSGVVEITPAGLNQFLATIDNNKRWRLERLEYYNTALTDDTRDESELKVKTKHYMNSIFEFGVLPANLHFLIKEEAEKDSAVEKIIAALDDLNYKITRIDPQQEAQYAIETTLPEKYPDNVFVVNIERSNTKIFYGGGNRVNENATGLSTYGSLYYRNNIKDDEAYESVKKTCEKIPATNRSRCFLTGELAKELAVLKDQDMHRYKNLNDPKDYSKIAAEKDKPIHAGLNIYKAIKAATGCKQFVADVSSNFSIGFLLNSREKN